MRGSSLPETKINPTSLASLVGCAAEQACELATVGAGSCISAGDSR